MAIFTGPLIIKEVGYELWEVVEGFAFQGNDGLVVPVKAGFKTDLASIPQVFQSFVPKLGYWTQAAVVHDVLYHRHRGGHDKTITRKQADKVLLEGAIAKSNAYSVPFSDHRHDIIYNACRMGGLKSWETPEETRVRLDTGDDEFLDG